MQPAAIQRDLAQRRLEKALCLLNFRVGVSRGWWEGGAGAI